MSWIPDIPRQAQDSGTTLSKDINVGRLTSSLASRKNGVFLTKPPMRTRFLLLLLLILFPGSKAMAAPPDGTAAVIYIAAPCTAEHISIVPVETGSTSESDTEATATSYSSEETDSGPDTPSASSGVAAPSHGPLPALIINEVFPDPEGSDAEQEFIELRNLSSFTAQLNGWSIRDAKGRVFSFADRTIETSGYIALPYSETKINLTNTGFSLSLISDDGVVRDTLDVSENAVTGQSYARTGAGEWSWTPIVTENAKNEFPIPAQETDDTHVQIVPVQDTVVDTVTATEGTEAADEDMSEEPPLTLQELSDIPEGQIVSVSGIVSLAPGRAGKTIFAMQNDEAVHGVFVRMYGSSRPTLMVGDQVLVDARIRRTNGTLSLNALSGGVRVLTPLGVTATESAINDIDDDDSGILMRTYGEVIDSGKNWLLLADPEGTREITAYLPDGAVTGPVAIGDMVAVHGVVRHKNGTNEILLLSREDIQIHPQDDALSLLDSAIPAANAGREPLSIDRSTPHTGTGRDLPWMLAGTVALSYIIMRTISLFRQKKRTRMNTR